MNSLKTAILLVKNLFFENLRLIRRFLVNLRLIRSQKKKSLTILSSSLHMPVFVVPFNLEIIVNFHDNCSTIDDNYRHLLI